MSLTIDLHLAYEFDVKASAKEAFALLSDVPRSASHYPKLAHLEDLGKNAYRWEMEPVGSGPVHVQTVYASKYVANKSKGTVTWTPVAGEGNARVAGSWTITEHPGFTRLVLEINGSVENLETIASSNSSASEELAMAMFELSKVADSTRREIGKFST